MSHPKQKLIYQRAAGVKVCMSLQLNCSLYTNITGTCTDAVQVPNNGSADQGHVEEKPAAVAAGAIAAAVAAAAHAAAAHAADPDPDTDPDTDPEDLTFHPAEPGMRNRRNKPAYAAASMLNIDADASSSEAPSGMDDPNIRSAMLRSTSAQRRAERSARRARRH